MRILIADDHELLRDTLTLYLRIEEDVETTVAADLPGALALIREGRRFDIVLLDYQMPGMGGLDGIAEARAAGAERVALMSGVATRSIAERALAAGAAGFLPKTLPARRLVNAVRFMAMGEQYAPLDFMTAETEPEERPHPFADRLSRREIDVLDGLCAGKANKQIARDLCIQEPTVKLHLKTLFRKLDVSNRTQAAMLAREAGLV